MIRIALLLIDLILIALSAIYDPELENPRYSKCKFIQLIAGRTVYFIFILEAIWCSLVLQWLINAIRESLVWG